MKKLAVVLQKRTTIELDSDVQSTWKTIQKSIVAQLARHSRHGKKSKHLTYLKPSVTEIITIDESMYTQICKTQK